MNEVARAPQRLVELTIDGQPVWVPEGASLLDACRARGIETPTLCYLDGLTPANACRACVVEPEGSRALVASCSRPAEAGMVVRTDAPRVRHSRRMVLELLGSAADLSTASAAIRGWLDDYGATPERFGTAAPPTAGGERERRRPGHHASLDPAPDAPLEEAQTETLAQPAKIDNELYVRDYAKCILCYRCVDACGADAQNTFAIAVAGRGFDARISTEYDVPLHESACVYCGNCVAVCPTGALMFKSEHDMREVGTWDESQQTVTRTVCPYCGVGCNLELHVQDNAIVKVTSPSDHSVTGGHLCIKGPSASSTCSCPRTAPMPSRTRPGREDRPSDRDRARLDAGLCSRALSRIADLLPCTWSVKGAGAESRDALPTIHENG